MNLPLFFTSLRIILIPFVVIFFYSDMPYKSVVTAAIFSIAAATDWFDGYFARRLGQSSRFGAFLDPVADKLLVVVGLLLIVEDHSSIWVTLPALFIIVREIVISALREWMATQGHASAVAVAYIGKVKTTAQLTALITLLLFPAGSVVWMVGMGIVALYIAALLSIWSLGDYFKAAWNHIKVT